MQAYSIYIKNTGFQAPRLAIIFCLQAILKETFHTDYKILMSIVAVMLNAVVFRSLHLDQTGFLKNRALSDNVHILLSLIDYMELNNKTAMFYFVDTEKVFTKKAVHKWNLG